MEIFYTQDKRRNGGCHPTRVRDAAATIAAAEAFATAAGLVRCGDSNWLRAMKRAGIETPTLLVYPGCSKDVVYGRSFAPAAAVAVCELARPWPERRKLLEAIGRGGLAAAVLASPQGLAAATGG